MTTSLYDPELSKKQQEKLKGCVRLTDIPSSYDDNYGVCRKNNFLPKELCEELLKEIQKENLLRMNMNFDHGINRCEIHVDNENEVVKKIISHVSHTIQNIETFTIAFSYSGSETQPLHKDYKNSQWKIYNAIIALHDMTQELGPTLFIPHTNTINSYNEFENNQRIIESPYVQEILNQGDAMIYDSNLLHCGTPNQTYNTRITLMIAFKKIL